MERQRLDTVDSADVSFTDSVSAEDVEHEIQGVHGSDTSRGDGDEDTRGRTPGSAQTEFSNPQPSQVVPEIPASSQDETSTAPSHLVKFTVTVTLAIPNEQESERKKNRIRSKSVKAMEALKPNKYYHMEWSLLPNVETTKLDLVTFGLAAKIYTPNESQVLKPWNDGEQMWLVFSHKVELPITKKLLLKLVPHLMTFQIWDSKDKVCSKAKFDRPTGLRLNMEKEAASALYGGGVKYLVEEQLALLEKSPLLKTYKPIDDMYPIELIKFPGQDTDPSADVFDTEISISDDGKPQSVKNQCADLKKSNVLKKEKMIRKKSQALQVPTMGASRNSPTKAAPTEKAGRQTVPPKTEQQSQKKKEKLASGTIDLDFRLLLAGDKSVTNKMDTLIPGILDALFTVSVDKSVMTEEIERELNPMVIRIISASSMPSTPVPIYVLQERCGPVYCQYQFYDLPCHQTKCRGHGTEISFKDVNVILTGTINPDKLREYLCGPPLHIEIHDRDRRLEAQSQPPALFGTEPEDTKLSNVGLVSSKRTVHDPFMDTNKSWNPYGIAKLNFSDLVYGEKCLNIVLPIQNSSLPDPIGYQTDGLDRHILGVAGAVDGPEDYPLPKGHYLESNSVLNVRVELAYPLPQRTDVSGEIEDCQFGRIIYIFDYKNTTFLNDLLEMISSINSIALCLDSQQNYENEAASKMDFEKKDRCNLDILTGFHVMDGKIHLFILEGLKSNGLKKLWKKLPISLMTQEEDRINVLYNSNLSFHQRLYANLDDNFYHIYLHEPLHDITKHPLLFIRNMSPKDCFQALYRLQNLCSAKKLREVVQNDLFPTAEMVKVLSREFGIPAYETDPLAIKIFPKPSLLPISKFEPPTRMFYSPLDNYNEKYVQRKQDQRIFTDHIQANIDAVYQASNKLKETKQGTIVAELPEGTAIYNYSNQALNCTEQAKGLLRQEMATKPNQYYTYSQEFLSATLAPVDIDKEQKKAKERSKAAWLTFDGFRYPGFRSSLQSNEHPKKPDQARINELKKAWKDNILHGNITVPIIQRDRWKWNERHKDFELYKKVSYVPAPVSIHLAGDTLRAEQLETVYKGYEDWRSKVIAKKTRRTSCRHAIDSELQTTGLEANTQLDTPMGASLKQHTFQKYAPSSTVGNLVTCKSPDQRDITKGFTPGLSDKHSWKVNCNIIPRYDMEHKKFIDLKGQDFNVYCNEHSRIYNRKLSQLNNEMQKTHLLQRNNPPREVL